MHKTTQFVLILFALLGILSILIFAGQYYTAHSEYDNLRDSTYSIYALPIPDSVRFVGEAVPLENFDVRESLDKELHKISYWHSETILQIKNAPTRESPQVWTNSKIIVRFLLKYPLCFIRLNFL